MQRTIFEPEHDDFRDMVRSFLAAEVAPHHERWERAGICDREVWTAAGATGLLGLGVPEEFGGGGVDDFRFNAVFAEEISRTGLTGIAGMGTHNDVILPYFLALASPEQRRRWLPGMCNGELISAIAMTEPSAGSDLRGIRTRAVRDGADWVVDGRKTFITNGIHCDLVIVVARTDPAAGACGFSLLVVERGMPGFESGRNLEKMGLHAQDTAELSFTDVRVPGENVLGEVGGGFAYLMRNLPQERLGIAVSSVAAAEAALQTTLDYTRRRSAFGGSIAELQNTKFVLAECATEIAMARAFVDQAVLLLNDGILTGEDAAMAKWYATELQNRVLARCVQLHGGYGFMTEYPIARAYTDARISTIYGGTTEIMKEIIGRALVRPRAGSPTRG